MWQIALLFLCTLLKSSSAYLIDLDSGVRTCFFEPMEVGGKISIVYEVDPEAPANAMISFEAYDPFGTNLLSIPSEKYGTYYIRAKAKGKHHYCFTANTAFPLEFSISGSNYPDNTAADPLITVMQQLKMSLSAIRDEQAFHLKREETHRHVADRINRNVLFWSVFQYLVIVLVCAWQVYYLRRFFLVRRFA